MKNLKTVFNKFNENKSAQFISFPEYRTGTGTLYGNLVINTNISQTNLNKANLGKLLAFDLSTFDFKGEPKDMETLKLAHDELIQSAKNSLLPSEKKNNRAKAQIDAYLPVNNAVKIHKETLSIKIMGLKIAGTVLETGEPFDLGKAQKTRYKNLIKQQAGFKIKKTWTLEKLTSMKVQGDTIVLQ